MSDSAESIQHEWYGAFYVAAALVVVWVGHSITNPAPTQFAGALGALALTASIGGLILTRRGDICELVGHDWTPEAPWSRADTLQKPECDRCGSEPSEYVISTEDDADA